MKAVAETWHAIGLEYEIKVAAVQWCGQLPYLSVNQSTLS